LLAARNGASKGMARQLLLIECDDKSCLPPVPLGDFGIRKDMQACLFVCLWLLTTVIAADEATKIGNI